MIVCVCHRVSDRDIHRLASEGVESFDEVQMLTGAATSCGRCESCARDTFESAQHLHDHVHANWIQLRPAGAAAPVPPTGVMPHRESVAA